MRESFGGVDLRIPSLLSLLANISVPYGQGERRHPPQSQENRDEGTLDRTAPGSLHLGTSSWHFISSDSLSPVVKLLNNGRYAILER